MTPEQTRATQRQTLANLLGGFVPACLAVRQTADVPYGLPGLKVLQLTLERADGVLVRGFLTGPAGNWHNQPALLYCHAHGGRYDIGAREVLDSRPALQPVPYAQALAAQGIVALAIDLPCFGERAGEPENLVAKRHLWQGTTLFGEMLGDLAGAIDVLGSWPGVDKTRIGAFGISMGATLAFWLAALDARIKALAHLCCFADLGALVELNGHDRHGLYMIVPGLLKQMRTGAIAGLAAPRPQFAAMGAKDPLTPPEAIDVALGDLTCAYNGAGAVQAFKTLIDPEADHEETPAMRQAVLQFFRDTL